MWLRSYRTRLQAAFVLLASAAIALTGYQVLDGAAAALELATRSTLTSLRDSQQQEVERYFRDVAKQVTALASDAVTIEALHTFSTSFHAVDATDDDARRERLLRTYGAMRTPRPDDAAATSAYRAAHERAHPALRRSHDIFGYYDVFLIDAHDARVVYTCVKEDDLGGKLDAAPLLGTGLGRAYARALRSPSSDNVVLEDYTAYFPSQDAPAAFVATPIVIDGVVQGVLAVQLSVDSISRMLASTSVRQAIIGPDGAIRAGERFPADRAVIRTEVPLRIAGVDWKLVLEEDEALAIAPIRALQMRVLGLGAVVAIVFLIIAWWLGRSVTEPVLALAASARRLGTGDFSTPIPLHSHDELGALAEALRQMASDLQSTMVSRDRLDDANRELQRLTERLLQAHEEERARLARELHDDVTQRMATVAMAAGRLKTLDADDETGRRAGLEQLQTSLARLSDDIHGLSRRLHPSLLDDLGLDAAVESECRSFFERGGAPIHLDLRGRWGDVPAPTQLGLFRIVQEALRNIARHAEANEVTLRLHREDQRAVLDIRDDGRGFERKVPGRRGLGLSSMEERIRLLNGRLQITSSPGRGTHVHAEVPL